MIEENSEASGADGSEVSEEDMDAEKDSESEESGSDSDTDMDTDTDEVEDLESRALKLLQSRK